MNVKQGLLYSKEHEWVAETSNSVVRIGISDYAQDQLGDVVFVELPEVDTEVTQGDPFAVVESVKAASDVFSPVTGKIVAVNENLEDSPELLNESPYDEGWLIEVEVKDDSLKTLLNAKEYESYLKEV